MQLRTRLRILISYSARAIGNVRVAEIPSDVQRSLHKHSVSVMKPSIDSRSVYSFSPEGDPLAGAAKEALRVIDNTLDSHP
jgi:hypothetical protein